MVRIAYIVLTLVRRYIIQLLSARSRRYRTGHTKKGRLFSPKPCTSGVKDGMRGHVNDELMLACRQIWHMGIQSIMKYYVS